MATVIAGWAAGYAMALVTAIALTFLATREGATGSVSHRVFEGVPAGLLAVLVSIGSVLVWTIVGLIVGSVYEVGGLESQPAALGSPSWPFSLAMVILALFPMLPLTALVPRYWWLWAVLAAAFAALFGWLMPVLAAR